MHASLICRICGYILFRSRNRLPIKSQPSLHHIVLILCWYEHYSNTLNGAKLTVHILCDHRMRMVTNGVPQVVIHNQAVTVVASLCNPRNVSSHILYPYQRMYIRLHTHQSIHLRITLIIVMDLY